MKSAFKFLNIADISVIIPYTDYILNHIIDESKINNKPYSPEFSEFGIKGTILILEYKFELTITILALCIFIFLTFIVLYAIVFIINKLYQRETMYLFIY